MGRGAGLRLQRSGVRPRRPPRLRQARPRSARAHRRAVAHGRGRRPGLGGGSQGVRLGDVPAVSREGDRAAQAVRPVLPARGRGLRPPARRLRARHEDGGGARGVRRAEGGPRPAHRRDRRASRRRRRLVPDRRLPDRRAEARGGQDPRGLRLHRRLVAARRDRPPVRQPVGDGRHPADDEAPAEQPQLDLLLDARVRPRHLRVRRRSRLRAHAGGPRHVPRAPRVAEPHVGEPRRPQPAVLAALLPARAGRVLVAAERRRRGGVLPSRRTASSRRSSASRRTRRRTTSTSSSASSWSRR